MQNNVVAINFDHKMLRNNALVDLNEMHCWVVLSGGIARLAVAGLIVSRHGIFKPVISEAVQIIGIEGLGEQFDAFEVLACRTAIEHITREVLVLWSIPRHLYLGGRSHLITEMSGCLAGAIVDDVVEIRTVRLAVFVDGSNKILMESSCIAIGIVRPLCDGIQQIVAIDIIVVHLASRGIPRKLSRSPITRSGKMARSIVVRLVSTAIVGDEEQAFVQIIGTAFIADYRVAGLVLEVETDLINSGCRSFPKDADATQWQFNIATV